MPYRPRHKGLHATIKSGWMEVLEEQQKVLDQSPVIKSNTHTIASSILLLARTQERTNILLQEIINMLVVNDRRKK